MSTNASGLRYRPLVTSDIESCVALWTETPGVGLSGADEPSSLARFLDYNAGLCWCAHDDERIVGTLLCGCDGRRGYLYHAAVQEARQGTGVGRRLVEHCLAALRARGIGKCHAMVFAENTAGRRFWERVDWRLRQELVLFSRNL